MRPTRVTVDGQAVEIRRSTRRRRTISARWEEGTIVVLCPADLSARAEKASVEDLVRRVLRKSASARNDDALATRSRRLLKAHLREGSMPTSVRWVGNMTSRWASCSPADGSIRLSDKLIGMPEYVVDAVLFHELVHLVEPGHGKRFQDLVRRYPRHDLAEAYLAGASFGARRLSPDQTPQEEDDGR